MAAMPKKRKSAKDIRIEELELRLAEAEDTLRAIREGEVDAVIVSGTRGEQVFSLVGTDSIYRLIVETMKEAAFTVTFDGQVLFCNAQFGEFVKRPLGQIVGHPLREFVAENDRPTLSGLLSSAQEQPVKQRMVFQALDGADVPAHVSANVLNQPDGMSICVVASDLTELENSTDLIQQLRRQQEAIQAANEELTATEEELRVQNEELATSRAELDRTRARFEDLFETAPDGYLVTDPDGTIQEANQASARLFGRPALQIVGNPFWAFLPAGQRETYLKFMAALAAGTDPLPKWEVEILPFEGPRFWANVTGAASRDEDGRIVGLRWLIRDDTTRKRAEDALRESEERFRLSMEATSDGLWDWDAKTDEVYYSPAYYRILGYEPGGFPGTLDAWKERVHPEDLARTVQVNMDCVEGRTENFSVEYRMKARTAEWRWILRRGQCISRDDAGRATRLIGTHVDVTARKEAEEALHKTAEELARSNRELEQFAYVASHDLQEPLRMVSGFLNLLRERYEDRLDEKARQYIGFAVEGSGRMSSLIKDLLAYSRVTVSKRELSEVDLSAVLSEAKANLLTAIGESGAEISADPLPTLTADARQMAQLFQNLIGNALKFRVEGRRPEIQITARREGGDWVFGVKDNGIGIAADQHDKIFVIFQRLHGREKYPGTGIGLAICKKIVEGHGGRIWVESEPDKGSTFFFTLPAGRA